MNLLNMWVISRMISKIHQHYDDFTDIDGDLGGLVTKSHQDVYV